MEKTMEIYIHIPFCERKCLYCDFVSGPADEAFRARYVKALIQEITLAEGEGNHPVSSVYFGGGTPSTLKAEQIRDILDAVRKTFSLQAEAEMTIEVNPGTADYEKFRAYKNMGFNRISMGLQSASDRELGTLGRIHTYEAFLSAYRDALRAGITNISVDLMSAIPYQTVESYRESLQKVIALNPAHISSYSLILEPGTAFYRLYGPEGAKRDALPSEEEGETMYQDTVRMLKAAGYRHYEISNYGKPGFESRHNTGYWKRTPYRGFGAAAASLLGEERFTNEASVMTYIGDMECGKSVRRHTEKLSKRDRISETMFLGLRTSDGIKRDAFRAQFGVDYETLYKDVIDKYEAQGLLIREKDGLHLSEAGIRVSNIIMADFLL